MSKENDKSTDKKIAEAVKRATHLTYAITQC